MNTKLVFTLRDGWEYAQKLPEAEARSISNLFQDISKRKTSGYNFLPCNIVLRLLELPSAIIDNPAPIKELCKQWQDRRIAIIPIISMIKTDWSDVARLYSFLEKYYKHSNTEAKQVIKDSLKALDESQSDNRQKVILNWNAKSNRLCLFRDVVGIKVSHEYRGGRIILTAEDCLGSPMLKQEAKLGEPSLIFGDKDDLVVISDHIAPTSCTQIALSIDTINILYGVTKITQSLDQEFEVAADMSKAIKCRTIISLEDVKKASVACYLMHQVSNESLEQSS